MREWEALQRLAKKEETALIWVIERYSGYVSTVVYNVIGANMTLSDVEEVTSDVFCTLWANGDRVAPGKLKAHLSGIARNKALEKTGSGELRCLWRKMCWSCLEWTRRRAC